MRKIAMTVLCLFSLVQAETIQANVTAVTIQGSEGAYRFAVTLKSDETGCAQYADWWEVLSEKGELLYRRILVHSHPDMQPFTRSGGSVKIKADDIVYVRAHMNKLGYVGDVFYGTVNVGFTRVKKVPHFNKLIEKQKPLPNGCAF